MDRSLQVGAAFRQDWDRLKDRNESEDDEYEADIEAGEGAIVLVFLCVVFLPRSPSKTNGFWTSTNSGTRTNRIENITKQQKKGESVRR